MSAFRIILTLFLFLTIARAAYSIQAGPLKAIVLINGEAYLVDVDKEGNILATYQHIRNYFSTNESHESILARLSKEASGDSRSIVFYEKQEEYKAPFAEENKAPVEAGNAQYIGFSPGQALLNKSAVDQIRRIAKAHSEGKLESISMVSFYEPSFRSRSIARNRADGIRDLLKAFGFDSNFIETSTQAIRQGQSPNFVSIHLIGRANN